MHLAMWDAVVSVRPSAGSPYLRRYPIPIGAVPDVNRTAGYAAHRALTLLYPNQKTFFDSALATFLESWAGDPPSNGRGEQEVGVASANGMFDSRAADGAGKDVPFPGDDRPLEWRPTESDPALDPHWGTVRTFAIASGSRYRKTRIDQLVAQAGSRADFLATDTYKNAVRSVRDLGRRYGTIRTDDQERAAHF